MTGDFFLSKIGVMKKRSIKNIRKKIDSIDRKTVKLLLQRMELSKRISDQKKEITDSKREEIIFKNITEQSEGKLTEKFLKNIFSLIIEESKNIQKKKNKQN